ncbi:ACT domain-containing protein [Parasedimentitalea maritima]|uniref:ACT domain-containing protein n=1 Tax=Parasedimentitalea maritima TaxID=2578117 RepID=A0A6A4RH24_9RHOB|nr:ACT domain-containing protein [Zongyanglinia marina]KAE9628963.1 ACT domain-containing protein [Zongyanglinia marina]
MSNIAETKSDMISNMIPELQPGRFVFATFPDGKEPGNLIQQAISVFKEKEGVSLILPVDVAIGVDISIEDDMRCITLNVYSSLQGVGLTAAVSTALGEVGIPCNMVAAYHHDHVFVPAEMSERAMQVLVRLQNEEQR